MIMGGDSIRVVHPLFREEGDGSTPISPLQLEIAEVDVRTAQRLNELWHSVLPVTDTGNLTRNKHYVFFAAHFKNRFYAVAIWTSPVAGHKMKDNGFLLELRRFAISEDAPANTASRMLKIMKLMIRKKYPEICRLVSYQHLDHHTGTIYKAAGWSPGAVSKVGQQWHTRKGREQRLVQTKSGTLRWEMQL